MPNEAIRSGLGFEVPYHETRIHGPSGCVCVGEGGSYLHTYVGVLNHLSIVPNSDWVWYLHAKYWSHLAASCLD